MSTYEFKLPDIGEGVTEGEIVKWMVRPGDVVSEDQPMVEVMTDKATVTITAPKAGKVIETRGDVGGVVPVHSVLVVFDLGGAAAAPPPPPPPPAPKSAGPAAPPGGGLKGDRPRLSRPAW